MTIVPIMIGAFGTVTKGLLKGLEDLAVGGRVETIQTTALLRTARIPRRFLNVTFRPLVKQTTTRNLYITIYINFLDGRLCEVGAVRRGIRIVRR